MAPGILVGRVALAEAVMAGVRAQYQQMLRPILAAVAVAAVAMEAQIAMVPQAALVLLSFPI